jgi:hypothetical protein
MTEDSRDLSHGRNRPFAYHDTLSPRTAILYAGGSPTDVCCAMEGTKQEPPCGSRLYTCANDTTVQRHCCQGRRQPAYCGPLPRHRGRGGIAKPLKSVLPSIGACPRLKSGVVDSDLCMITLLERRAAGTPPDGSHNSAWPGHTVEPRPGARMDGVVGTAQVPVIPARHPTAGYGTVITSSIYLHRATLGAVAIAPSTIQEVP